MPRGLISTIAWIVLPSVAAYLMRRFMVPNLRKPQLPPPVQGTSIPDTLTTLHETTKALAALSIDASKVALAKGLKKGSWGLWGVATRMSPKTVVLEKKQDAATP